VCAHENEVERDRESERKKQRETKRGRKKEAECEGEGWKKRARERERERERETQREGPNTINRHLAAKLCRNTGILLWKNVGCFCGNTSCYECEFTPTHTHKYIYTTL